MNLDDFESIKWLIDNVVMSEARVFIHRETCYLNG